jgi:hypothetical protein
MTGDERRERCNRRIEKGGSGRLLSVFRGRKAFQKLRRRIVLDYRRRTGVGSIVERAE